MKTKKLHRHSLAKILVIALVGTNACTIEQAQKNSRNAGATTDKEVTQGTTSKVVQLTDGTYDAEVLRSSNPVLIFFWAPWSAPDRMMAPTIEAVAIEYAGRVKVARVNVDDNADLSRKFGIKAIPTLILIENGTEQERAIGAISKEAVGRMLEKQQGSNP